MSAKKNNPETDLAWYVLRTYPKYEVKVKEKILSRIQAKKFHALGMQVLAPVDIMVDERDKEQFTGFVLVKMRMRIDTWELVTGTPGVVGYIGFGVKPTPYFCGDWMDIPFNQFPKG